MARYRKIDVRMWDDDKFRKLSPIPPCGQGLWVFLLTNPATSVVPGLFRAGEASMAESLGWPLEAFREAFREGIVKADWKARVVWVPNVIKYDPPASANVVKSWSTCWDEIPDCELKIESFQYFKAFLKGFHEGFLKAFLEGCPEPFGKASRNPDPDPDPDPEKINARASGSKTETTLTEFTEQLANSGITIQLGRTDQVRYSKLVPVDQHEIDYAIAKTKAAKISHAGYVLSVIEGERKRAAETANGPNPPPFRPKKSVDWTPPYLREENNWSQQPVEQIGGSKP